MMRSLQIVSIQKTRKEMNKQYVENTRKPNTLQMFPSLLSTPPRVQPSQCMTSKLKAIDNSHTNRTGYVHRSRTTSVYGWYIDRHYPNSFPILCIHSCKYPKTNNKQFIPINRLRQSCPWIFSGSLAVLLCPLFLFPFPYFGSEQSRKISSTETSRQNNECDMTQNNYKMEAFSELGRKTLNTWRHKNNRKIYGYLVWRHSSLCSIFISGVVDVGLPENKNMRTSVQSLSLLKLVAHGSLTQRLEWLME